VTIKLAVHILFVWWIRRLHRWTSTSFAITYTIYKEKWIYIIGFQEDLARKNREKYNMQVNEKRIAILHLAIISHCALKMSGQRSNRGSRHSWSVKERNRTIPAGNDPVSVGWYIISSNWNVLDPGAAHTTWSKGSNQNIDMCDPSPYIQHSYFASSKVHYSKETI